MSVPLQAPATRRRWPLYLALMLPLAAQAGQGLSVPDAGQTWPRWQLRLSLVDAPISRWSLIEVPGLATTGRAALLGDYDLGTLGLQLPFAQGRFRATSGWLFSLRQGGSLDLATATTPYFGLGWSGGVAKTGLSFSADLGVWAAPLGEAWRLGQARLGTQDMDGGLLRDLRLQPRLQLGVQYSY